MSKEPEDDFIEGVGIEVKINVKKLAGYIANEFNYHVLDGGEHNAILDSDDKTHGIKIFKDFMGQIIIRKYWEVNRDE